MFSDPPTYPANVVSIIRRRPGRPRTVRPKPLLVHDERDYVARVADLARESMESDQVVRVMNGDGTPTERLDVVIRCIAEECSGLLFERERLMAEGRDGVPDLCSRRAVGLLKRARLVLERERLRRARGEMDDTIVLKLVEMLFDTTIRVVGEVATPQQAGDFERLLRQQVASTSWVGAGTPPAKV